MKRKPGHYKSRCWTAGGITECKRIADIADTFGILWSHHVSTGFPRTCAASIHLAVATPNAVIMEAGNIHKTTDVRNSRGNLLLKEPLEFKPGYAVVPEKPGSGEIRRKGTQKGNRQVNKANHE